MSEFISNLSLFIDTCLVDFIGDLFTSSVGIMFVGVAAFCVVGKIVSNLMHTRF